MPQEIPKEHKCSHHVAAANRSSWYNFHFSGKVIMCSVLFGLGFVLIGGLVFAIGIDQGDDSKPNDVNEIQNKAPMSVVGPVIMGIGSFTVIVGIAMCFFETNICRKREPDSTPLISDQASNAGASNATSNQISVPSQKRQKHRHHKKSPSPRRNKGVSRIPGDNSISPSSRPIDVKESSRDFTSSDKFMTPSSSFIPANVGLGLQNQMSPSLLKSFTSSGKSWTTSTEFQTPPSSPQDSSGSFEPKTMHVKVIPEPSNLKEPINNKLQNLQHEFLTPKNSNAENVAAEPESVEQKNETKPTALQNSIQDEEFYSLNPPNQEENVNSHDFLTPQNSYVPESPLNSTDEKVVNNLQDVQQMLINAKVAETVSLEAAADKMDPISAKENTTVANTNENALPDIATKIENNHNRIIEQEKASDIIVPLDGVEKKQEDSSNDTNSNTIAKDAINVTLNAESNIYESDCDSEKTISNDSIQKSVTDLDCLQVNEESQKADNHETSKDSLPENNSVPVDSTQEIIDKVDS